MSVTTREGGPRGRVLWRSLEEYAETEEFRDLLSREFPSVAPEFLDPATRRQFLRVMGASILLAGATGCVYQPPEAIIPYVVQPERVTPGRFLQFATAVSLGGYGMGVLAESREGRPIKVEGNPDHPASLGSSDPFMHASMLDLYDPDRSQVVTRNGRVSTWDDFFAKLSELRTRFRDNKGAGLHILTGAVTSPTLERLMGELRKLYPETKWYAHEPADGSGRAGTRLALGREADTIRHLDKADVIVSLDSDFLTYGPARLNEARRWAERREVLKAGTGGMNRLHLCEPALTNTGAVADHRLPCRASRVPVLARAIAEGVAGEKGATTLHESESAWVRRVVADLKAHRGSSLVLTGEHQPAAVHALVHALNAQLGNVGKTVEFIEPVAVHPTDAGSSLAALARAIDAGSVKTLLILGPNPVYDAPVDLEFRRKLSKLNSDGSTTIHLGTYEDETAKLSQWHLPESHTFEAWGDVRAFDGTATIQQPLIKPLYEGRSAIEVVAAFLGIDDASGLSLVRETWKDRLGDGFEDAWRAAVHDGVVPKTARATVDATPKMPPLDEVAKPGEAPTGMELVIRPDPTVFDGRFSNNGWLQGLPKPITKLMWDNAARLSPATAERLRVKTDQVVELRYAGRTLRVAVWVDPGHDDNSVSLTLGYGRTNAGRVGSGQGFNAYVLRTNDAPWGGGGLDVLPTEATYRLATRQHHQAMEGREIVRAATLEDFLENPKFAKPHHDPAEMGLTLYPQHNYDGYKWGMSINLNTCIGCNSCVTGCQSENNIPVLDKDQNLAGRDMFWIRVDRYYEGEDANNPEAVYFQPVPCMHCENAPCELVCPVNATVHDAEGLNVMVYNRCVGTRYCSNNCPYKVRRFNFLQYSDWNTESLKILYNPEVTVRTRGVMEKCTYCIQRIVNKRIEADAEGRTLADGEVKTACQTACPTNAIVFGDLNKRDAAVTKLKADPRDYSLLGELNTRPRTTYVAKITNPAKSEA